MDGKEETNERLEAVEAGEETEEDTSLANSDVTTKYKEAAKIANFALQAVINACVPGARVIDLCKLGDGIVTDMTAQIYRAKKGGRTIEKGIAFPTCVSVNECVCHFSPLESDEPQLVLNDGDLVKVDIGCHIDGYISVAAHTIQIGEGDITGVRADVVKATYTAAEVAVKLIRAGNTNAQVTAAMKKVADAYGVNLIAGTLMHQMKRHVIDAPKVIILREEPDQKVEECSFDQYEVYAIDVAMSSGEGKPRELDARTTVFKRQPDRSYRLKMKAARHLFNEANNKFPTLPFSLRGIEDERQARLGVRECLTHGLLQPYPVLYERPGDQVAHVKFTVLLLPSGTTRVAGLPLTQNVVTDKQVDEETAAILSTSSKKKKNKKKKGEAKDEAETTEA